MPTPGVGMGKRLVALLVGITALLGVPGLARAQEWSPSPTPTDSPSPSPTPTPTPTVPPLPEVPVHAFLDINGYWAESYITATAVNRDWLRWSGAYFRPTAGLTRIAMAYGFVRAFGRDVMPTQGLTFTDVPTSSWMYRYANVAVTKGWLTAPNGVFDPKGLVNKLALDVAITRALGLVKAAGNINKMQTSDGYVFKHTSAFGYTTIGQRLHLYYNFPNAMRYEIYNSSVIKLGEFAYALWQAANAGWRVWTLQNWGIPTLPPMSAVKKKVVEFAMRYSGAPYTYAGTNPRGGVDCSGFVWWVLRAGMGNESLRGYRGWSLAERSSYYMATVKPHYAYSSLAPLDVLFWDTDSGGYVRSYKVAGHTGIYLGNGFFIHSTGSQAGVALDTMDHGYWGDQFLWGRRVVPATA